jgi:hypothetical protein
VQNFGRIAPRERGDVSCSLKIESENSINVIARSESDEAIQTCFAARRIASRSLSSGAHSRDPLARNDGVGSGRLGLTPLAVRGR